MLVLLRRDCAHEPPGDMIRKADSHCVGLGRGLRFCISNKFLVNAAGAQIITLCKARFMGLPRAAFRPNTETPEKDGFGSNRKSRNLLGEPPESAWGATWLCQ